MVEKVNAADFFPLNGFNTHLENMSDANEKFDPKSSWSNRYEMFSLAGRGSEIGSVKIERRQKGGRVELSVDYRKRTSGKPVLVQQAELEVGNDLLSTPTKWNLFYRAEKVPGSVMPETEVRKNAKCAKVGMRIDTDGVFQDERVDGPFAVNWALFDAVQRMPRKAGFETEIFTLFDHFDQRKESQQIKYWNAFEVILPNGKILKLHAFEQIGRGILPIYYWVTDQGQLMAVISGIEGYILQQGEED